MTKTRLFCTAVAYSIILFSAHSVSAQESMLGSTGIMADGTERIELKPEKIRLLMWVKSQGADAKSAVRSLNEHKDRVKKDLIAMKAEESSIVFSTTRVAEGAGEQDANMRQYSQMMRRSQGDVGKKAEPPVVFTATAAVKAEWKLPVQEGDALALLPVSLTAQIKTRDLAGEKNKPQLDAAQQEQSDEMTTMMEDQFSMSSSSDSEKGPAVTFIASATDDQIQAATKAAFAAAAKKAETLVAATGLKLGKLIAVYNQSNTSPDPRVGFYSQYQETVFPNSMTNTDKNIISAANTDDLAMSVMVMVRYELTE